MEKKKYLLFSLKFFPNCIIIQKRGLKMEKIMCVLDDEKECDNCMECEICDLDDTKICDNCGKCLDVKDFVSIKIDKIITDPNEHKQ